MKNKHIAAVLFVVLAAGCAGNPRELGFAPPIDGGRRISEQDCTRPIVDDGGNLKCREITETERRARIEEEQRQAAARKEAEARAERERIERERAELAAREEAARQKRLAEEAAIAAAAARKAQAERELREKAEAEARARQRAEQLAREEAARECRRLEEERLDGRALLEDFVKYHGSFEENRVIAGQISAFLAKPRKAKPCPPA